METEIIDKLFLELSQFTTAKSKRELEVRKLRGAIEKHRNFNMKNYGYCLPEDIELYKVLEEE